MSSDKPQRTIQRVRLIKSNPGPVLREKLTDQQIETVRAIHAVVQPYFPSFDDFELWFRRDPDPDSELQIWSAIAKAYQRFIDVHDAALVDELEAAFTCILLLVSKEETPPPYVSEPFWNRCRDDVESQTRDALLGN